jgi:hypothetical protein
MGVSLIRRLAAPFAVALLAAWGVASVGAELPEPIPLQCRLGAGPWRSCQMRVDQLGVAWQLHVNGEAISFSHDGQGNVRMQRGRSTWVPVQPHWSPEAALCWDGVCAKGDLPLD